MRSVNVAQVVRSENPDLPEGSLVLGMYGWQDFAVVTSSDIVPYKKLSPGISPVMAPLFAIASAADVANPQTPDAVAGWRVLPAAIERDALNLIGLGPSPGPALEPKISEDSGAFPWKSGQAMIPRISWR